MEKSDEIKIRLLQVAKNKGISYEKFFKDFGTTYENFKGKSLKSSLRSKVLGDFSQEYPDIDLNWLITGKRKIEKEKENLVMEEPDNYENNYKDKYLEVLEENRQLSKELIAQLKKTEN
ncbi:hypothetical protein [uncultured Polaribacter sp.]|uniref:hypothetical protein n=1 Tax=uncultured Polaribacter sp. TaxID=174711 RepID=UPI0026069C5D|nr:hypothetical protein [uncultured Polaribacter sp.]